MSTGSNRPGTEGGDELMHKDDQHESTFPAFLLTPCGVKGKFLSISTQREFLPLPEQQGTLFAKTVFSSPRNDSLPQEIQSEEVAAKFHLPPRDAPWGHKQ
ncbi:unnamed protein product [Natator depressus]